MVRRSRWAQPSGRRLPGACRTPHLDVRPAANCRYARLRGAPGADPERRCVALSFLMATREDAAMAIMRRVVVFDASDLASESAFWAEMLGGHVLADDR